jgi:hypothetical protein
MPCLPRKKPLMFLTLTYWQSVHKKVISKKPIFHLVQGYRSLAFFLCSLRTAACQLMCCFSSSVLPACLPASVLPVCLPMCILICLLLCSLSASVLPVCIMSFCYCGASLSASVYSVLSDYCAAWLSVSVYSGLFDYCAAWLSASVYSVLSDYCAAWLSASVYSVLSDYCAAWLSVSVYSVLSDYCAAWLSASVYSVLSDYCAAWLSASVYSVLSDYCAAWLSVSVYSVLSDYCSHYGSPRAVVCKMYRMPAANMPLMQISRTRHSRLQSKERYSEILRTECRRALKYKTWYWDFNLVSPSFYLLNVHGNRNKYRYIVNRELKN